MTTKIAIRCNTDANKGYGNFTRCITLAKSLKKYSLSPIFLIDDNKIIKSELKKYKISYHLLKKYNHIEESKEINILLTKKNIKFLILDLREKSETLSRQLMKYNFKTILIDDAFCTNIYSDIVFNGTIVKSFQNYNYINNDTLKFLGPKYFLSESGFSKFSKKSNDIVNKKIFTIVVSFGGSDPTNMKTHAKKDGNDWILNGAKMWITNGSIADICVAWAMTDEGVRGFIVEKDMPGFETQEIHNKFSLRASVTASLFFDNVRIPESNVLPNIVGMKGPLSCLSQARYGISWGVIGAAQACLNEALNYTNERVLFNRPVSHTQTIQIRLAEMARRITTAQLLSFKLGKLKDSGKITPSQISIAKWNNCRMALDIARDARDILGGSGISAEYVPIRHMLNLESVITYEGTETVHQLIVGKELTGVNAF